MSEYEDTVLQQDADLDEPLRRVAYEAGMLLGLEATRSEQDYHRRRLTRQQYWLHGFGTLAGMAVSVDPPTAPHNDPITVRLIVGPGMGIDAFGREVLVREPYCIDLGDWLKAQSETALRDGYDVTADPNLLWLQVTARHHDCPVGMQPVLARKLNLSTDAVQPSRIADSVLLELAAALPRPAETRYQPFGAHPPLPDPMPALTPAEDAEIQGAPGDAARRELQLHARLLHAFDHVPVDAQTPADRLAEGARVLLARISIQVPDLATILNAHEGDPVVNPNRISVNNLVRPFLASAGQVARLLRA